MHKCLLTLVGVNSLTIGGQTITARRDPYRIEVDNTDFATLTAMHAAGNVILEELVESYATVETIADYLDTIVKQITVANVAGTYTLDISTCRNFTIESANTNPKTIAFSNIPVNLEFSTPITVKFICTAVPVLTQPSGVIWEGGSTPSYTAGKTYYISYMRAGTGWHASCTGEW